MFIRSIALAAGLFLLPLTAQAGSTVYLSSGGVVIGYGDARSDLQIRYVHGYPHVRQYHHPHYPRAYRHHGRYRHSGLHPRHGYYRHHFSHPHRHHRLKPRHPHRFHDRRSRHPHGTRFHYRHR